jgi:hypothetical protein
MSHTPDIAGEPTSIMRNVVIGLKLCVNELSTIVSAVCVRNSPTANTTGL